MKGLALKAVMPGAALALAMSALVAMAGPGGFAGTSDEGESTAGVSHSGEDDGVDPDGSEAECFVTVLNDGSSAYLVLDEHTSDSDMPEGGVAGNQHALDRICFGELDGSKAHTTPVTGPSVDNPGRSGDAPGRTGDAPGRSEDAPGASKHGTNGDESGPGKSEDAPGQPGAPGEAQGDGQQKADTMGMGPADAPGQNRP